MAAGDRVKVVGSWSNKLVAAQVIAVAALSALLSWLDDGVVAIDTTVIVTLSFIAVVLAYRRRYRLDQALARGDGGGSG